MTLHFQNIIPKEKLPQKTGRELMTTEEDICSHVWLSEWADTKMNEVELGLCFDKDLLTSCYLNTGLSHCLVQSHFPLSTPPNIYRGSQSTLERYWSGKAWPFEARTLQFQRFLIYDNLLKSIKYFVYIQPFITVYQDNNIAHRSKYTKTNTNLKKKKKG